MELKTIFKVSVCYTRGEVLPIMAYTGRLRPKGVGILRAEVYERVGRSVI